MIQLVFTRVELLLELIVLLSDVELLHLVLLLLLIQNLLLLNNQVSLRLNLVLKSDLLPLQVSDLFGAKLILLNQLSPLVSVGLLHLVHLHLVLLLLLLHRLRLLVQLLVYRLQLLGQERDLTVFLSHGLIKRIGQLLDILVQVVLDLFSLLLLEQDLVLVVDLRLCQSLVALVTHVSQPLLEAHLLGVVELLEIGKLLLGCHINLIDGVL